MSELQELLDWAKRNNKVKWDIENWDGNDCVRIDGVQAAAELAKMNAVIEAARRIEFCETTGVCLLGCGGDSESGHNDGCVYQPVADALEELDKVTK